MAYDFIITDGRDGESIDSDGITCSLDYKMHEQLFAALDHSTEQFPHLGRFRDHYKDGFVEHELLELLIAEIELASSKIPFDSLLKPFFGTFHSLCCIAWARDGWISGYCD